MIENKTGIPTFGIATNGMHSYVRGAGEALRWIVKRFCPPGIKADRPAALKVNILGVTPLDFFPYGKHSQIKGFSQKPWNGDRGMLGHGKRPG